MIRFALKSIFALGLGAALFSGNDAVGTGSGIDLSRQLAGAQSAIADLGNFCDRAPEACVASQELSAFFGRMLVEGALLAYRSASPGALQNEPSPQAGESGMTAAAESLPTPKFPRLARHEDAAASKPIATPTLDHAPVAAIAPSEPEDSAQGLVAQAGEPNIPLPRPRPRH